MRIAVSADDKQGLDSAVSPHFGRCPAFVLVDVQDCEVQDVTVVENPFYGQHQPGQVPGFIKQQGADVMLTGGMGARAVQFFKRCGVEAVTGASGTVRMSLERYLGGELEGAEPCAVSEGHQHGEAPAEGEYEEDAVGRLKEEAEGLQRDLEQTLSKLNDLLDD